MGAMLRLLRIALIASAAMLPATAPAHAFFLPAFLGGLLASFGAITPLIGIGSIGVINAGFALGTFLQSGLGSLLLSVGLSAASYFLTPKPQQGQAPPMESARVNVRVPEPERWLIGGRARSGGSALFGEFDDTGAFWYLLVHSDSELVGAPVAVQLDDIVVALDDDHRVTTPDFTLEKKEGSNPVFSVWTTTYDADDPTPPPIAAFKAKFPAWTDDHRLVGTTYSVVRVAPLKQEVRYTVMTWRGPFGMGEPALSIVGDWGLMYDPRDPEQDIDDRSTWKTSSNLAIVWAWFRTHPFGRGKPMSSVAWDMLTEQADICDQTVLDKNGVAHKRYSCGVAVADSKERGAAEQEIMLAGDAVILTDGEGRAYIKVGHWEEPTLSLTRRRDILAIASRVAQDGEMQTDGVVVRYTEPDFGWIAQPCAAWKNPRYFEEGRTPRFLQVDILACPDHNQAVRLAKAIGETSQAPYRLAPTVGLRGIEARRQRIVDLQYDEEWAGPHKIATPVEDDEAGLTFGFGIVPIDADHWTLLPGEEGDKPAPVVAVEYDASLPLPTGVSVSAVPVPGTAGASVRLEAVFDASPRIDRRYEFQYRKTGAAAWRWMAVLMDDRIAYSDTIDDGSTYEVQYRTVATSGRASDWKSPPVSVSVLADPVAPGALSGVSAAGDKGFAICSATIPRDNTRWLRIWWSKNAVLDLNDADNVVVDYPVAPGQVISVTVGDSSAKPELIDQTFDTWTLNTGWTDSGDNISHVSGSASLARQIGVTGVVPGDTIRVRYDVSAYTSGTVRSMVGTGSNVFGAGHSALGTYRDELTSVASGSTVAIGNQAQTSNFVGSVKNWSAYKKTAGCLPIGAGYIFMAALNGSRVPGPTSAAQSVTVD